MIYTAKHLCEDLAAVFYPPKFETDEAKERWYGVVKKKLKYYSSENLQAAYEHIVTNRKARAFPTIADMLEAVHKTKEREVPAEVPAAPKPGDAVAKYTIGQKTWDHLMADKHPMLREAALQNWHMCLKAFVCSNNRLPNESEVVQCKRDAEEFLRCYEECVTAEPNIETIDQKMGSWQKLGGTEVIKAFVALGDSMLAKRGETQDEILGGKIDGR